MKAASAGLLLVPLAAGQVSAQLRPRLIPMHDVDITYQVTKNGGTLEERVRWLAARQLERVDPPGPVHMIVDHMARRLTLVNDERQTVLEMEAPPHGLRDPGDEVAYAKGGLATVAGLACTEWTIPAGADAVERLCVTDDGVLLRLEDGGTTTIKATEVTYRRLDPATFEVPADYRSPPPVAAPPPPGTGAQLPE